jgi:hypothetical protein
MTVIVALSALAQIFLKLGITENDVQASLRSESISSTIYYVMTSPQVIMGLSCFGLNVTLWLHVLSRVPLSTVSFPRAWNSHHHDGWISCVRGKITVLKSC